MSFMRSVVSKPTTVLVVSALMLFLALFMITLLPQELTPEMNFPTISVTTIYRGAGPEEVESSISKPLESALLNISGVKKITSTSQENYSSVTLNFDWDRDLDAATNDIRDKLDSVRNSLPEEAESPTIFKLDINSMIPVMYLMVYGEGLTSDELKPIAEDQIQPYLERVDGVSEAQIVGGREKQVRVEAYQNRLEAYNVTMTQVTQAISAQNIQLSAGNIEQGNRKLLLRTTGEFGSIEDVQNVVVAYRSAAAGQKSVPIRLRDIANVFMGYEDETSYSEFEGQPALTMTVMKQSGANSLKISKLLTKQINDISRNLPNGVIINVLYDSSTMTTSSINQVTDSAMQGLLLVVVVLVVFLRNLKSAGIVAITMPLSIFVTLMCMYFAGLTLNLMSLTGLTLGVGMMVDSSIVILENITRYREKGVRALTSSILGSQEMVTAIMASTLTTVCVFLPIVLFNRELEIAGVLFKDLSFTIVISLLSSLAFSVTLVPVLAGNYMQIRTTKQRALTGFMGKLDAKMAVILDVVDTKYSQAVNWALNNRKKVVALVVASLFAAIIILATSLGFELMPSSDQGFVQLEYKMPVGSSFEATRAVGQRLQAMLMRDLGETVVGILLSVDTSSTSSRDGNSIMVIQEDNYKDRIRSDDEIKEMMRGYYDEFPGVDFSFSGGGMGGGSSSAVTLNIASNNQELLEDSANRIVEIFKNVPILKEPESNSDDGLPEAQIEIDRNKAYSMGLTVAGITTELAYNVDGATASIYRVGGKDIDIRAVLRKEDRASTVDLDKVFVISSSTNERVPLSNIAALKSGFSPVSIKRENQTRQLTVTANAGLNDAGRPVAPSQATDAAMEAIDAHFIKDDNVQISQGGNLQDFIDLIPKLIGVLVVAILLVYSVMASQFESLKDPFIIILSLATLPIGPILIYLISGQAFSVFSVVGMIILVGIVVNNGIVLVDYTNLLRRRGYELRKAVVEAARLRLRPILMTSLTTIFGMIPMAMAKGDGTSMTQPIGVTVTGGMISSTIMTLFFVPVLYYNFNRKGEAKRIAQEKALKEELAHG